MCNMSRKSKAEYIGEKRPSAAPARPTSSPNCRASALSGELDRSHAGGGMGAFRPTPWLRPRGRPCALHHPVRSPLRPNAEYSNQQLLADVWCYPVGTAFHRRPYHVTAPVGTAFHRRPPRDRRFWLREPGCACGREVWRKAGPS